MQNNTTRMSANNFNNPVMYVKFLEQNAIQPERASDGAAGFDLFSNGEFIVPAWDRALISTGIALHIPAGYYGRIAPRSGNSWKHKLDIGAGVIDNDYRGEIKICLINNSDSDFRVLRGFKCAQIIIEKYIAPVIRIIDDLEESDRGSNGFGSTGDSSKSMQMMPVDDPTNEAQILYAKNNKVTQGYFTCLDANNDNK